MRCAHCEMVAINGYACHEVGCPNMGARWDGTQWIKQRRCRECGCKIDASEPDCCILEEAS